MMRLLVLFRLWVWRVITLPHVRSILSSLSCSLCCLQWSRRCPLVAVPCISCIFSWYAGRLLAKSRDGVGHGRLVRRQSGDRSPRSGLHVLGSGAPHRAPASKSFAHQRAEDLRRSERSAVHEEARVQEHLGAYRCLSDEYPQQIVPWCPSSRSGAHVRRRTPRGRPRGTAWRTATRQPVVLVVGPQRHPSAHTRASTLAPGAGRGVCMVSRPIMAPGATPARLWAGEVEHRGGRTVWCRSPAVLLAYTLHGHGA